MKPIDISFGAENSFLDKEQLRAINELENGKILVGGVGSGKSRTSIAYYFFKVCGGNYNEWEGGYLPMTEPLDLYIITTAKKRDSLEWDDELSRFLLSREGGGLNETKIVIDSWNNITKYKDVKNAFFIFDEQRLVGYGTWVKSFLKIAKSNQWILLTATPGDTWMDYIPVFIANGFYRNKTEFVREHVIFSPHSKFPKIDRYIGYGTLMRYKDQITVKMNVDRDTIQHHCYIDCDYDMETYDMLMKKRWNPVKARPCKNISELCSVLRTAVNLDLDRYSKVKKLILEHPRVIIFYNLDMELFTLRNICAELGVQWAEWNGHRHESVEDLPKDKPWAYLVQYTAGAEGWNCVLTDTIIFFSQNYSYKIMTQAAGRIDRRDTEYKDLWYYHMVSKAPIDRAISKALSEKKKFNEGSFVKW